MSIAGTFKTQSFLAAVCTDGTAVVIEAEGQAILHEIAENGVFVRDMGIDDDDRPDELGLHVWEGNIVYGHGEIRFAGKWRRASTADLGRFGITLDEEAEG
jgi:hypothetical protein